MRALPATLGLRPGGQLQVSDSVRERNRGDDRCFRVLRHRDHGDSRAGSNPEDEG